MRRRRRNWPLIVGGAVLGGILVSLGFALFGPRDRVPAVGQRAELRVEVLNGCGVDGAAMRAAARVRRAGYRVESTGTADNYHYRRDVVVVRSGDRDDARPLLEVLDHPILIEQRLESHDYDITVIVGTEHRLVGGN